MNTFRTQFPVCEQSKVEDLLEIGKVWINGSPHTHLNKEQLMNLNVPLNDEEILSTENESIEFSRYNNDIDICGIKYINSRDTSLKWTTEIVGAKTNKSFWVSVSLSVATELPVGNIPFGKKPYIVRNIIDYMKGGTDGKLTVSDTPIYLDETQIDFAADIINGTSGSLMPIVYISSCSNNKPYVNPNIISKWVSGMAHVVVEPTRGFSFNLMEKVSADNVYGGAVAIYWPSGSNKWLYTPQIYKPEDIEKYISNKIRKSLLSQETKKECTWSFLQEIRSKKKIENLKSKGSKEIDDYIAIFDKDIETKNEEIEKLKSEINRLKYRESYSTRQESEAATTYIPIYHTEKNLYQDEIIDILISTLKSNLEHNISKNTRRYHVLKNIINLNKTAGLRDQLINDIKLILKNYNKMDSSTKKSLKRLGFEIVSESNHYKLIFKKDKRYPVTLAKTGSDYRGGKNAATDIKKRLF